MPSGDRRRRASRRYGLSLRGRLIGLVAVLLVGSVAPVPTAPGDGGGILLWTAPAHLLGYALLGWLAYAYRRAGDSTPFDAIVAVAFATTYGAGIELLQWPLPHRQFSLLDVALNGLGSVVGVGAGIVARRRSLREGGASNP